MKPKLSRVIRFSFAIVHTANVKFPDPLVNRTTNRNSISHFPVETIQNFAAHNAPLAILDKILPLIFCDNKFWKHGLIGLSVYGELGKKVTLILIYSTEPGGKRYIFNSRDLMQSFLIGNGERHNE